MLTTPVDLRFSLNFLFSICPLPFLALGPELFFSLLLLGEELSLSLSVQPAGLASDWGLAGTAFCGCGAFFGFPVSAHLGAGVRCGSSSGLLSAEEDADRAMELDATQLTGAEPPLSGLPLLLFSSAVGGAELRVSLLLLLVPRDAVPVAVPVHTPVAAAMSPSIFALIFSRFAFHSSKKSVEAFGLNPPVAMFPCDVCGLYCFPPGEFTCASKPRH